MEKPFYKRKGVLILAVLVGFLLLFVAVTAATVSAARRRELNATPTPSNIPTESPTPTPLPNYHALSFDPDLGRMEGMNAVPEDYRQELGRAFWVDITPANEPVTGYTLFRHVELGYSFLLLPDGRYLRLGEPTEGCGVVNALFAGPGPGRRQGPPDPLPGDPADHGFPGLLRHRLRRPPGRAYGARRRTVLRDRIGVYTKHAPRLSERGNQRAFIGDKKERFLSSYPL